MVPVQAEIVASAPGGAKLRLEVADNTLNINEHAANAVQYRNM